MMIEIFGISISEPMTMLTDYILAAISAYISWSLFKQTNGHLSRKYWALASVFVAAAAFWGGTFHGFYHILTENQAKLCWRFVVYSVSFSTFFCTYGTAVATLSPKLQKWLLYIAIIKFIICFVWIYHLFRLDRPEHRFSICHY